jgi:hypothetical protein
MKKIMLTVAIVASSLSISFGGEGDKVKVVSNDTTSSKVVFDVTSDNSNILYVDLKGVLSELSSISLIDRNGETLYYNFVQSPIEHLEIDLTSIKPGMYYVKLNMDSEIRMKLVVIDNQ